MEMESKAMETEAIVGQQKEKAVASAVRSGR